MRRTLVVLAVLVSTLSAVAQQPAAPAPPQLTWVRFYNVDRAHTRDFMDVFNRMNVPVLDKLLTDRQIVSWGLTVPFTMTNQDWTHSLFITVNNWASGDSLIRAFDDAERAMTPADMQRDQATMAAALKGVHDVVLRHVQQSTSPPAPNAKPPQYIRVSFYTIKAGRNDDAAAIFREYAAPFYTELATRGVIGPWGFSTQEVATDPSFTHVVWLFLDSLQRLDQIRDASMARPATESKTMALKVQDASESEKYHSEIMRIVRMGQPPAPPAARR
ncbi:MAG TPA: hypothetical protein VLV78_19425 [Thermoanaerobaculia bacterium]|nr:hypothetical protein [Thermoanaerobaculia bacterium]